MKDRSFDTSKNDAQATKVNPVGIEDFNISSYRDYCGELEERCTQFMQAGSGVLVYRRMRVAEVFSYGCRDMRQSLEWQLGALKKSMDFAADVPNFLEPWYGIGLIATAFGIDYLWNPGQSPAVKPAFATIDEALARDIIPVKDTPVGRHSLNMIEYFLEQTRGEIPMSMGDIQSPFNNATNIVDTSAFLISMLLEPEKVVQFLDVIASLEIDFYQEQKKLIGNAMVKPGHGFASSLHFEGIGVSDDNIVMVDSGNYMDLISPSLVKLGNAFGGTVHHSCGNFSDKATMLPEIPNLKMADAAFTAETDPHPNPPAPFRDALAGTGIILNARMVGDPGIIAETTRQLWTPDMKLIVVTFSPDPEEQREAYRRIHSICS